MIVSITIGRSSIDSVIVFLADVQFAAHNGFDSCLLRGIDEMHCPENIAVVSHGHGWHSHFLDTLA